MNSNPSGSRLEGLTTTADVYEFHSSPESTADSPTGSNYELLPSSLQKSSSSLTVPGSGYVSDVARSSSFSAHGTPPPKRIKTAILAKELLAAAAASKSTDPMERGRSLEGLSSAFEIDSNFGENEAKVEEGEEKKVPPLRMRILLPKSGSEDGKKRGVPRLIPTTGTTSTGGKKGDETQPVTRSRVRQSRSGVGGHHHGHGSKRRSHLRPETMGRTFAVDGIESEAAADMLLQIVKEEVSEGPFDEEKNEESRSDSGDETSRDTDQQDEMVAAAKTSDVSVGATKADASGMAGILAKNSYEQSMSLEQMIHENWAKQYTEHQKKRLEQPEETVFRPNMAPAPIQEMQFTLKEELLREWPDSLKKLALEQTKRRQELAEDHRFERDQLLEFGEREYSRLTNRTSTRPFSIVKMLHDGDVYNCDLLSSVAPSQAPTQSLLVQLSTRLRHMAVTTRNRHNLEAQSLFVCQKAEWEKAQRMLLRKNDNGGDNPTAAENNLGLSGPDFGIIFQDTLIKIEETIFPRFMSNILSN